MKRDPVVIGGLKFAGTVCPSAPYAAPPCSVGRMMFILPTCLACLVCVYKPGTAAQQLSSVGLTLGGRLCDQTQPLPMPRDCVVDVPPPPLPLHLPWWWAVRLPGCVLPCYLRGSVDRSCKAAMYSRMYLKRYPDPRYPSLCRL